ncbi:hypothetical protein NOR_06173 [Metarhizium rileyi]|uniref:Metallo-beta-lactamase domain-containing protein n=1 Tax=Metarhizium rileyi (strain RCEF 4871) TaxID=1649241 RepID=A0A167B7Z5_METRR|nr:hypothetical protein NOR_06173 [Metarhizium rileyi RCEF 4871]
MATYSSTVTQLQFSAGACPEDAELKKHHKKDNNGRFVKFENPYPSFGVWRDANMLQGMVKVLGARLEGKWTKPDLSDIHIPTATPVFQSLRHGSKALRASWLGHACCFVEFASGLRVLFDPVFEDRIGPGLVQKLGTKRLVPAPCSLADIPAIDAVIISHSHPDHLSWPSVREIFRLHPNVQFFVGLGLASWFRDGGIHSVSEMDWWEDAELVLKKQPSDTDDSAPQSITARISCLPSQHTSWRTGICDRDRTLWASWSVTSGEKSVWFGGDTGYRTVPELPEGVDDYGPEYANLPHCPQFSQIGKYRGPFDLGMIPIGAYKPRYLLSPVHSNPSDAVEIFRDVKCRQAMAIHWGTWALSSEEINEPPRLLREGLKSRGMEETGVFDIFAIGETREF